MSAAEPLQGANCAPLGGSAAAIAASVGVHSSSAARVGDIAPFHVMEVQTAARALEAAGRSVVHMEIGEPDFPTPGPVIDAAQRAIADGAIYYTSALGLPELRAAIARHYADHYGVAVSLRLHAASAAFGFDKPSLHGALVMLRVQLSMTGQRHPLRRHSRQRSNLPRRRGARARTGRPWPEGC